MGVRRRTLPGAEDIPADFQQRIRLARDLAHKNLREAQAHQKGQYDRRAKEREFEPGQRVLVLLPTSTSNLLTQWQGPFEILRRVGPVDYEVHRPGHLREKQIYHVNLLWEWWDPEGCAAFSEAEDEELGPQGPERGMEPTSENTPVRLGEELTLAQQQEARTLIDEFRGVFCEEPGWVRNTCHAIKTPPGAIVRERWRSIPHHLWETVRKEVESMLQLGVIRPSRSPWRSPLVPVRKPDGSLRLCMDYRHLNAMVVFDVFPMPHVAELVERIGDARYISTLDMAKGYWQIPVAKRDRQKMAFGTPWGLYKFLRMPFGLHSTATTFQRLMDQILVPHTEYAATYIDDIIIYTQTWEQHLGALRAVLVELRCVGLTANPRKCTFAQKETKYLGFLVGRGTIKPLANKVEIIRNFTAPQDCCQLWSFLGLTNYYRRFVPHFAELAAPLLGALKGRKTGVVRWTEEMIQSFEKLKRALCEDVIIHTPDFQKPFILQTDASETAVGAVLTQGGGGERPVAYASRKLLPAEKRYATIERECLAIWWAVDYFRYYLIGREFTLVTDHAPLKWLSTAKSDNARITRWALELQPYKFRVTYRPGKTNTVADFLCRCGNEDQAGDQKDPGKGWTDPTVFLASLYE
ncbi:retrotransposon-like protein 1 [Alligator mississippiensis]|uniref:ribonuclease H n=1 Tax=Alligator mississippiensis TaxID=8496 RepID=A0A151NX15_ALLMI|nr:retrotransposon-like protein 1 [Alligator mississippiensis]